MSRLIIYGDIHGCYDEFTNLRKKINLLDDDIEVCVGDIITKGKNSIKVLKYIQKHNIQSVLGNHEDKIIRYLNHQKADKKNPIVLDDDEQNIVDNLNAQDIEFLENLPISKKFGNVVVIHGGLQNHHRLDRNLSKNTKSKILRLRFLDINHDFVSLGKEDESSIFWADIYDGNQGFIVYGHQHFNKVKHSKNALGIDTGCVYGNQLSAVIFTDVQSNKFAIQSVSSNIA